MNHRHLSTCHTAALLAAVPLIAACPPSRAATEPPSPPAPPAVRQGSDVDLDAQLEAARKRLDEAAHEVARLSTQMSGAIVEQVMPYVGPGRAIIGVQLEPVAAGAWARVRAVSPGGPAAEAGIRAGDVIVAIAGHEVDDPEDLRFRIATLPVGAPARLSYWRGGKQQEASATLVAPPEMPPRDTQTLEGKNPLAGITVSNLNPALTEELSLDSNLRGVVVNDVRDGSYAQRIGLQKGDIVVSVNSKPVPTVAALRQLVSIASGSWSLSIKRGGQTMSVTVRG